VPWRYKAGFPPRRLELRPNIPENARSRACQRFVGILCSVSALDDCCGIVLDAVKAAGIGQDTIVSCSPRITATCSARRECRGRQGPWDESDPDPAPDKEPRILGVAKRHGPNTRITSPAIMPTILSICGYPCPGLGRGARPFGG